MGKRAPEPADQATPMVMVVTTRAVVVAVTAAVVMIPGGFVVVCRRVLAIAVVPISALCRGVAMVLSRASIHAVLSPIPYPAIRPWLAGSVAVASRARGDDWGQHGPGPMTKMAGFAPPGPRPGASPRPDPAFLRCTGSGKARSRPGPAIRPAR
ncbi:MAG: hypothetical protein AVDCRST_MAG70-1769 [uncultured Thermomicrobiales bacterium]|uniref:Uncharacterized protein n=1 Tax=uncultured Thermomicrobiales bacterium TaxID=1645740 RepID=A0A6J4UX62_9BACT|nr:MAG: hypothetical protein AVDCRST_MAG70-1769 [uncultured Thermomicrobiales bacterium]